MRKKNIFVTTAAAVALVFSMPGAAQASSHLLDPFTQPELDTDWEADRLYPSGGVKSVTFDGRDNVAEIAMDSSKASSESSWWGYEGIKKVDDFGVAVQVDLYVPSAWQNQPANAGFWASDAPIISAYPIIAFRNSDSVDAGFYTWDGAGWAPSDEAVNYDAWNTLSITLNNETEHFNYAINGVPAGTLAATGDSIGQVFLNQYNYGSIASDAVDYSGHWHAGLTEPQAKDDCKNGGHADFGFSDQGQCIKFLKTGQDSR